MQTCPSCRHLVDAAAAACPSCDWPLAGASAPVARTIIQPSARPKLPVAVLLNLGIDITSSSGPFADGIRGNIDALLKPIEAKAASLSVTVQSSGDEDEGQLPTIVADRVGADDARAAVQALHFYGGGDPDEHHLNAVEALAANLPVAPGRQRGALLFFCTADSKPASSGRTAREIGAGLAARGIVTCIVGESGTAMEELAHAAQGAFIQISATPSANEMARVAELVAASILDSLSKGMTQPLTLTVTA